MATSRLEKLGSIFGRITALMRSGAMARQNRPLWYDVYQVFPPKQDPSYGAKRPMIDILPIFYPEDTIRAKFHKKIGRRLPADSLIAGSTSDVTRRAIDETQKLMAENEGLSEDEAIDRIIVKFKKEAVFNTKRFTRRSSTTSSSRSNIQSIMDSPDVEAADASESDSKPFSGSFAEEFELAVKSISDKNVNVSKNMPSSSSDTDKNEKE